MKINYKLEEDDYSKVIYGDSVTSETPVVVKSGDNITIQKVSDISNGAWKPYIGFKMWDILSKKEYSEADLEIYTNSGWSNIKKVIRHRTAKKIYRITTNVGLVEVTEDHSLLDANCQKIKPMELLPGVTTLLHDEKLFQFKYNNIGSNFRYIKHFTQIEAMKSYYHYKSNCENVRVKYSDGLYSVLKVNDDLPPGTVLKMERINSYNDYVYDIETEDGTFQAGVGSLIVKNTDSCMIELKTKSYEAFKKLNAKYKDHTDLQEEAKEELQALKTKVLEESFKEGERLAHEITEKLFKSPIELEFEKVYNPFIILTKKRYIGNYYGKSPYKIDMVEKKGVVLSRRDNANIAKIVYEGVIDPLLKEGTRGVNKSIQFLKGKLQELKDNSVDLDDLVITKTLAKGYGKICKDCDGTSCSKCKDGVVLGTGDYKSLNSPHVAIAVNQRKRDVGSAPVVNDRISYVFVKTDDPKAKLYEKAEELSRVKEKGLEIDSLYYIQNQIKNPVCEVLNLILDNPEGIFEQFTKDMIPEKKTRAKKDPKQPSILKWIAPKKS
jgi:hypothetical protein